MNLLIKILVYSIIISFASFEMIGQAFDESLLVDVHNVDSTYLDSIDNAEMGMMIFNRDDQLVYYFDSIQWKPLGSDSDSTNELIDSVILINDTLYIYENRHTAFITFPYEVDTSSIGDIKHGFQTSDHNGWFLLDGRDVSTLDSVPRMHAVNMGYTTTLPDPTGNYISQTNQPPGTIIPGVDTITILKENLPNINLTATGIANIASRTLTFQERRTGSTGAGTSSGNFWRRRTDKTETITFPDYNVTLTLDGGEQPIPLNGLRTLTVNTFIYLAH